LELKAVVPVRRCRGKAFRDPRRLRTDFTSSVSGASVREELRDQEFNPQCVDLECVDLALTDRSGDLKNCMSLIQKARENPESRLEIAINLFIFNNMAERVRFESGL
jgi:hypothetical protein